MMSLGDFIAKLREDYNQPTAVVDGVMDRMAMHRVCPALEEEKNGKELKLMSQKVGTQFYSRRTQAILFIPAW